MPVYWVTLIPPVLGCFLIGVNISYPTLGYLLAPFGLQSMIGTLGMPPVNGALWSLSVEIYLSASLIVLAKIKPKFEFIALFGIFLLPLVFKGNIIVDSLSIFYAGFLLPGLQIRRRFSLPIRILILCIALVAIILKPNLFQVGTSDSRLYFLQFFTALAIIISTLNFESPIETILAKISQRSYSLYAAHSPILLFVDKFFYADQEKLTVNQLLVSLIAIIISAELVYRTVEIPSIRASRRYLSKK
jgi:peptidoglycan/LPS O-acetylase OafA/YrhL